ncbi:MAG: SGNH/GDSL hydrolase family protein [Pseudomonadota bacterium]|nr:SGNH/GDSL hydrolase family protein [Pseudomonadota bacterium]
MKTVLAFGDSLTWGYDPEGLGRHDRENRWPVALGAGLAGAAEVIAEGQNGRTTAFDDHLGEADRNGARILPVLLTSHKPLDLVVIMLGTNDLKPATAGPAVAARQGMEKLASLVRKHDWSPGASAPGVLIVSPPPFCKTENAVFAAMFDAQIEESRKLAGYYADLARDLDCGFFDAGSVAETSPLDGIHLDARNTRAIGKALVAPVARMLEMR